MRLRTIERDNTVSARRVSWGADSETSPTSAKDGSDDETDLDTATCGAQSTNALHHQEAAGEQSSDAQRPSLSLLEAGPRGANAEPLIDRGALFGCGQMHLCWKGCSEGFARWLPKTEERLLRSLPVAATYFDGMFIFVLSRMWADLLSIHVFRLYPHMNCRSDNIRRNCHEYSPEWQLWLYAFGLLFVASLADTAMSIYEDRLPNVVSTVRPILSMTCGWSFGDASARGVRKRSSPNQLQP